MNSLTILAAVLLIVVGALYPLAALLRINQMLRQRPAALILALHLLLMATLPLGAILGGVGLLRPTLWQNPWFSTLVIALATATAGCLLLLLRRRNRPSAP